LCKNPIGAVIVASPWFCNIGIINLPKKIFLIIFLVNAKKMKNTLNNVVIGFNSENNTYIFNETGGSTIERELESFNRLWSDRAMHLSYDSRYLILAIFP